jgi:hypothetical protein
VLVKLTDAFGVGIRTNNDYDHTQNELVGFVTDMQSV